jgi:hypothetical protein
MLCTRADLKKEQETAQIAVNYIGIVNLITVAQNELIVIMAVSYQHYMEYVANVQKGMVHNDYSYAQHKAAPAARLRIGERIESNAYKGLFTGMVWSLRGVR